MPDSTRGHRGPAERDETPPAEGARAMERALEGSNASILMADEMGANAMAHGETTDFDRLHEESLAEAAEIEWASANRPRAGGGQGRREE